MHDEWQDLIPYYVNRTLPDGERAAFERHLSTCDLCRRAVEDWHVVAGAVYNEVDRWARQRPALSDRVRASLGLPASSNGHGHYRTAFSPGETFSAHVERRARRVGRRTRLPLTLVAAAAMVVFFGALLIFVASRGNEDAQTPLSELKDTPSRTPRPATLGAATATPLAVTTPDDLGILPLLKSPTPTTRPVSIASLATPTSTRYPVVLSTPTVYAPVTPTAAYQYGIGSGFVMVTTQQVGAIPTGARVRISHAWYDGAGWIYGIVAEDEETYAEAREWQLSFAPDVTPGPIPPAAYGSAIGMGYLMVTTTQIGVIPPGTRVRISHAWHDGYRWMYYIVTQDEQTYADAYEWQIAYAPDVTPGPTPTAVFGSWIGTGYLRTTEQVGAIPAGARVRIGSAWFDGIEWIYEIVAEDGFTTAQARTGQLTYDTLPGDTPTPTPTSLPVCAYSTTLTSVCPIAQQSISAAYQPFENGFMVWAGDTGTIYVFYSSGRFEKYPDTWVEGETFDPGEPPPSGLIQPVRGFGKVWATQPGVRAGLGWALSAETGYTTLWETHAEGGAAFRLPDGRVVRLTSGGWSMR